MSVASADGHVPMKRAHVVNRRRVRAASFPSVWPHGWLPYSSLTKRDRQPRPRHRAAASSGAVEAGGHGRNPAPRASARHVHDGQRTFGHRLSAVSDSIVASDPMSESSRVPSLASSSCISMPTCRRCPRRACRASALRGLPAGRIHSRTAPHQKRQRRDSAGSSEGMVHTRRPFGSDDFGWPEIETAGQARRRAAASDRFQSSGYRDVRALRPGRGSPVEASRDHFMKPPPALNREARDRRAPGTTLSDTPAVIDELAHGCLQ